MNTIRPDHADPIPRRVSRHRLRTLLIRFIGLLVLAMVVMALAWR